MWFILVAWKREWRHQVCGKKNFYKQWRQGGINSGMLNVHGPSFCPKGICPSYLTEKFGLQWDQRSFAFSLLCCWWHTPSSHEFDLCPVFGVSMAIPGTRIYKFYVNYISVLYTLLINTLYYDLVLGAPLQSCKEFTGQNVSIGIFSALAKGLNQSVHT